MNYKSSIDPNRVLIKTSHDINKQCETIATIKLCQYLPC